MTTLRGSWARMKARRRMLWALLAIFSIICLLFGVVTIGATEETWQGLRGLLVGIAGTVLLLTDMLISKSRASVVLDEESVSRSIIGGATHRILWVDVTALRFMSGEGEAIQVISPGNCLSIASQAFEDYVELLEFLASHLPQKTKIVGVFPSASRGRLRAKIFRHHGFDVGVAEYESSQTHR